MLNLDDWEMGVRDRDVGIHRVAVIGTLFAHPSPQPPNDPIPLSIHVPSSVTYGSALDDFSQIQSRLVPCFARSLQSHAFVRLRPTLRLYGQSCTDTLAPSRSLDSLANQPASGPVSGHARVRTASALSPVLPMVIVRAVCDRILECPVTIYLNQTCRPCANIDDSLLLRAQDCLVSSCLFPVSHAHSLRSLGV